MSTCWAGGNMKQTSMVQWTVNAFHFEIHPECMSVSLPCLIYGAKRSLGLSMAFPPIEQTGSCVHSSGVIITSHVGSWNTFSQPNEGQLKCPLSKGLNFRVE